VRRVRARASEGISVGRRPGSLCQQLCKIISLFRIHNESHFFLGFLVLLPLRFSRSFCPGLGEEVARVVPEPSPPRIPRPIMRPPQNRPQ
jgi:hypothetical protein